MPADLRDLDAVGGAGRPRAFEELGRLDIVVNNVGGTIPNAFLDTTPDYLEEAFRFNVSTAHALTRAAVPLMLRHADRDHGSAGAVVNISSVMGRLSGRGYLAYGTAKAALAHWTRLAARDLDPHIRVNAIAVGSVMTSALEFVAGHEETSRRMEAVPRRCAASATSRTSPRPCSSWPSPAGGYVTGKVLEVDGGLDQPNLDLGLPDLEPTATEES